jgi:hypothetical protein
MKRKWAWPEILAAQLKEARNKEFEWGKHDCCLFAANVVKAITGKDYAKDFRGKYHSEKEAEELIQAAGGLEKIVSSFLPSIPPLTAQRGDVLMFLTPMGPALGVCGGDKGFFVLKKGLISIPIRKCQKAWRV